MLLFLVLAVEAARRLLVEALTQPLAPLVGTMVPGAGEAVEPSTLETPVPVGPVALASS